MDNVAIARWESVVDGLAASMAGYTYLTTTQSPGRQPQPLAAKVEPEPYPLDALPETIRAAVEEVQGFVQAPLPMVASSALGALSLAVQAHVDVKRCEKLTGPTSLFLLTLGDSGERKSTCDRFFLAAIKDYQAQQAEAMKPEIERFEELGPYMDRRAQRDTGCDQISREIRQRNRRSTSKPGAIAARKTGSTASTSSSAWRRNAGEPSVASGEAMAVGRRHIGRGRADSRGARHGQG